MKIGIVGPADRTMAWENHLRPHPSVSEVVIAATLEKTGPVDAYLLLDESDHRLDHLLEAVRSGHHTFFISKLPTDPDFAQKVHHTAEEANVQIQFSHWPTLSPASQWMSKQVSTPSFLQITRNISQEKYIETNLDFRQLWIDDLAYCLKYTGGSVHHIDVNTSRLQSGMPYAIHINMRFESGTTAVIFINTAARQQNHERFVSDHSTMLSCNVDDQSVRIGREDKTGHLFFKTKSFDPSLAAEQAVTLFLKSVQLNKPTPYNSLNLRQLTSVIRQIDAAL